MMPLMPTTFIAAVAVLLGLACNTGATEIGTKGTQFTINDQPTFLLGCSYYGGLGATEENVRGDLDELKRHGINWVRVWATWASFEFDVSAVTSDTGGERRPYRDRLKHLIEECDDRGMAVDV